MPSDASVAIPPSGDWLRYAVDCATEHAPSVPKTPVDELRIYDNSIHRVRDEFRATAQGVGGWPDAYLRYLGVRMRAFALLAEGTRIGIDEFATLALSSPRLVGDAATVAAELLTILIGQEKRESDALVRRLEQLPRASIVSEWYVAPSESEQASAAFERWANAVLANAKRTTDAGWAALSGDLYRDLVTIAREDPSSEQRATVDRLQPRLVAAANELALHLRGNGGLSTDTVDVLTRLAPVGRTARDGTPVQRPIVVRLAYEMVNASDGPADILNEFVVALARVSNCELCDFMLNDNGMLRASAISDPASKLRSLLDVPYHRGEGIAGSALLLSGNDSRRWVGTNLLARDPRQSILHAERWEKATETPIHDYWVFPVFDPGDRCFGAFRVFNRLPAAWEAGTPWTEQMLWELREVATWFETYRLPHMTSPPVGARTVTMTAHSSAVQHLRAIYGLEWLSEEFFLGLLTHLTQVAHRKVEALSLGCCVGAFANPSPVLTHAQRYYAGGQVSFDSDRPSHLDQAALAYPKINPRAGMFVFDGEGTGSGVISFRRDSGAMASLIRLSGEHPKSLLFLLDRAQDCIRIVVEGLIAADYYLSEATGEWTLRMYRQMFDIARRSAPGSITEADLLEVFRRAVELSYKRIGAMLVLGDGVPDGVIYEHATELEDVNLRALRSSEFADMAAADGAVCLEPSRGVTRVGAIVRTTDPAAAPPEGPAGSRHSAAAALSSVAPDHMVFVVSENRALSVFSKGALVIDRK